MTFSAETRLVRRADLMASDLSATERGTGLLRGDASKP